jgi:hypothetical protein
MGIEELIGFLLGVACGGLLRYFKGDNNSQAKPILPVQQLEPGGRPTDSAAGAPQTPFVRQNEFSALTPAPPAGDDVGVATQHAAADEPPSTSPTAAEEKKADLKTAILEIIRSSEEGLTLSAIAEKMKRHFASIIGPVRLLIEEGLIEKQDKIYKIRGVA